MKGHLRSRDRRQKNKTRRPNTIWQLVVEGDRDVDNNRRQHFRSFHGTKSEAESALREFIREIETGVVGGDQITVAQFIEKWIDHKKDKTRSSTLARYADLLRSFVKPRIGARRLRDVRPIVIQNLYDEAGKTGNRKTGGALSPKTIGQLHRVLSAAFKQAVGWQFIASNPCSTITPPRVQHREMRALNGAESRTLLEAATGTRLFEAIYLTLAIGFRRGELLGLQWCDVDFDGSTISVNRTLNADLSIGRPKTSAGSRTVVVPSSAMAALKTYRARQYQQRLAAGSAYNDQGFVFADVLGEPWKPNSISTLFRSICKRAGVEGLRFHDLRHTAASLMIDAGLAPTIVAKTLGHANPGVTMTIYAHALKGSESAAAAVMETVFKGIKSAG